MRPGTLPEEGEARTEPVRTEKRPAVTRGVTAGLSKREKREKRERKEREKRGVHEACIREVLPSSCLRCYPTMEL